MFKKLSSSWEILRHNIMVFSIFIKEVPTSSCSKDVEKENPKKISEFRIGLSQILACTATNFVMLQMGMALQISTIVIPALLKAENGLKFTTEQASWFGSLPFICQPIGAIISGFISNAWGRKRTLMLDNIPFILGWLLMYTAYDLYQLYIAAVVLGLAMGFKAAPIINYVGEVCQPKWRGVLSQYTHVYNRIGFFFMSLIGALTDWQTAAAIASSVSIVAVIVIAIIPESPAWLVLKGRDEEAQKSLSWLRGWATPEDVKDEFENVTKRDANSYESKKETQPGVKRGGKRILHLLGIDDLCRNDVLRPFILVNAFLTISQFTGVPGMHPYMIQIFQEFGSSLNPYWCAVINSAIAILGNLIGSLMALIVGKRAKCHVSFLVGATCCFFMSLYGYVFVGTHASWVPVTLYFLLTFLFAFGVGVIPWQLLSEVFPIHGRSLASGISSAFNHSMLFIATKTYYDVIYAFTFPGSFAFFAVINFVGWIFLYFFIPETEGKSLEEVQFLYANVLKKKNHERPTRKLSEVDVGVKNDLQTVS